MPKTFSRPKLLSSIRNASSMEKIDRPSSSTRQLFEVKPSFSMVESRDGDSNQVSVEGAQDKVGQRRKSLIKPTLDFINLSSKWKKKGSYSSDSKVTEGEIEEESAKNSAIKPPGLAVSHLGELPKGPVQKPATGISFKQLLDCDLKHPVRLDLEQLKEKMKLQTASSQGIKPILIHTSKKMINRPQPSDLGLIKRKSTRHEEASTDHSTSSKRVSFSRNMMVKIFRRE